MGCINSKQTVSVTPAFDHSDRLVSGRIRDYVHAGDCSSSNSKPHSFGRKPPVCEYDSNSRGEGRTESIRTSETLSFRLRNLQKYVESEQVAAGWPAWLTAVAGEAIDGWLPLKAESYEKLEKIGQGTYSSVYKAKELATGRMVALKKVRFDNFEPESVRFMSREILILRRLNHPNVMKLDGLITSRLSCSIYLVFEYMEHDITGLLSSPDIKFSESQVKCYVKQLLEGIEHCHLNGVMHRDIKGSNLLVNNEGQLKVADFGLANFSSSSRRQPLTSRVVTLWYRPPELLLGSTEYSASVDLWSVGCVFAEILFGKPILQGRTEVEQLHKIFKLCGSPPEEYWKKPKLPYATLFRPQQPYESSLKETFKEFPSTIGLLETLLSVEPNKRGTASSALKSAYFTTKPLPCDPSVLPKYPPSKEMDAKLREARRVKAEAKKPKRSGGCYKPHHVEINQSRRSRSKVTNAVKKPSLDRLDEFLNEKNSSKEEISFSGPLHVSSSSGFAWARRRKGVPLAKSSKRTESNDSFDLSGELRSQDLPWVGDENVPNNMEYHDQVDKVDFSGPLLSNSHRVDELMKKHDRHIRQVMRRSWFQKGKGR